jgi:hypothetical protein
MYKYGDMPIAPTLPSNHNSWSPFVSKVVGPVNYRSVSIPYPDNVDEMFTFTARTVNGEAGYECVLKTGVETPATFIIPFQYNDKRVLRYSGYVSGGEDLKAKTTSIYVPDGIYELGYGAFSEFTNVKSINLPSSVYALVSSVFYNAYGIESLNLPNIQNIGADNFVNCPKLKYIILGSEATPFNTFSTSYTTSFFPTNYSGSGTMNLGAVFITTENGEFSDIKTSASYTSHGAENKVRFSSKNFQEIKDDSGVYIVGDGVATMVVANDVETEYTFPTEIRGVPVKYVGSCLYGTTVEKVIIPEGIERVLGGTCGECANLKEVSWSSTCKNVGEAMFYKCSFSKFSIPEHVVNFDGYCFYGCTKLTSMTIPQITDIPIGLFNNCDSLLYVILGNKQHPIKTIARSNIGYGPFTYCSSLTYVFMTTENGLSSDITLVGNGTHGAEDKMMLSGETWPAVVSTDLFGYIIVDGYAILLEDLVKNKQNITEYEMPDTLEGVPVKIFTFNFAEYSNLTSIKFSKYVEKLPTKALSQSYSYNAKLTSVILPENLVEIGDYAFNNCSKITTLDLPPTLEHIGDMAFYGCVKLSNLILPSGIKSIGIRCFSNTGITSLEIPNSLTSLGGGCFSGSQLTSITIPAHITSLPDGASYGMFEGCQMLTDIYILGVVKTLGQYTFGKASGSNVQYSAMKNIQFGSEGNWYTPNDTSAWATVPTSSGATNYALFKDLLNTNITFYTKATDISDFVGYDWGGSSCIFSLKGE